MHFAGLWPVDLLMFMKNELAAPALLLAMTLLGSCDFLEDAFGRKDSAARPSPEISKADSFARDVLNTYYLWTSEIAGDLPRLDPDTCLDPVGVVREIRYHAAGREVDHWTVLTDDFDSFTSSMQGLGLTYGYELQSGRISNREGQYFLVVTCVYPGGPAQKAGLKRGDIIVTIDGKPVTRDNLYDALDSRSVILGVTFLDGDGTISSSVEPVAMSAEDMYLDPVMVSRTFDLDGKKVGYLFYNSFDIRSQLKLPDVFRRFKEEGVTELVLDLRYNGGGYARTETMLASLIAPSSSVAAKEVFQTDVYNSSLMEMWAEQGADLSTRFSNTFEYEEGGRTETIDITDAHPSITRLYALVTGSSASASEALLVGLAPYLDITIIGEQTYGKYCAGFVLGPGDVYKKTYDYSLIDDWGIYVMVSKFADRDGRNAAEPDGIPADVACHDDPFDGFQLGDEGETMLRAALSSAGKTYPGTLSTALPPRLGIEPLHRTGLPAGLLVKDLLPQVK